MNPNVGEIEMTVGRPKVYKDDAEKMRAYRARKKANNVGLSVDNVRSLQKKNHKKWAQQNNLKLINIFFKEDQLATYAIYEENCKWAVASATLDKESSNNNYRRAWFENKELAEDEYSKLCNGSLSEFWYSIDFYLKSAESFVLKFEQNPNSSFEYYPQKLGFLLALSEVQIHGSQKTKALNSALTPSVVETYKRMRRVVLAILGNIDFPFKMDQNTAQLLLKKIFLELLKPISSTKKTIKTSYYNTRLMSIFQMIAMMENCSTVFSGMNSISQSWKKKALKEVKKNNMFKKAGGLGILKKSTPYKFIHLVHVQQILDIAWDLSPELYHHCVLELTLGLRMQEFDEFIKTPFDYVLELCKLNYSALITKTEGKIDLDQLTSPRISIVALMIVSHHRPKLNPKEFFSTQKFKKGFRTFPQNEHLSEYSRRSFRKTCSSMIKYCSCIKSGIGAADVYELKNRLGHTNLETGDLHYAEKKVSDLEPHKYFKSSGKVASPYDPLKILSINSILWDTWLLRDYVRKHTGLIGANQDKHKDFWNKVEKCAEVFNFSVTGGVLPTEVEVL